MGDSGKQNTFLITGGTGSLGTHLTKHLLQAGHKVRAYARNEHSHETLERSIPEDQRSRLSCLMGAVEDAPRLRRALAGVEYVIHTAAQKVIGLAEYNPWNCVQTNVVGTHNLIEGCLDAGVKKAILVSTDKARGPSTLYGATKLCAERLWLAANRYRGSQCGIFSAVAYGNVYGSRGSVLHAFATQAQYGSLSLTDPQMTRFHVTLDAAVAFVLEALASAASGTLWIPKLPSYRLGDFATAFERVYEITKPRSIVGRRPAEKLHEDLVSENESCSVLESTPTRYVLEPGQVHEKGGWSYSSGNNTWRMSIEQLEGEIREWAKS